MFQNRTFNFGEPALWFHIFFSDGLIKLVRFPPAPPKRTWVAFHLMNGRGEYICRPIPQEWGVLKVTICLGPLLPPRTPMLRRCYRA